MKTVIANFLPYLISGSFAYVSAALSHLTSRPEDKKNLVPKLVIPDIEHAGYTPKNAASLPATAFSLLVYGLSVPTQVNLGAIEGTPEYQNAQSEIPRLDGIKFRRPKNPINLKTVDDVLRTSELSSAEKYLLILVLPQNNEIALGKPFIHMAYGWLNSILMNQGYMLHLWKADVAGDQSINVEIEKVNGQLQLTCSMMVGVQGYPAPFSIEFVFTTQKHENSTVMRLTRINSEMALLQPVENLFNQLRVRVNALLGKQEAKRQPIANTMMWRRASHHAYSPSSDSTEELDFSSIGANIQAITSVKLVY